MPSLRYAQEAAESFQHDETWGERISVKHEKAVFPVFMSGLPEGVSGEELKKQVEAAAAMDPKAMKMQGEPEVCQSKVWAGRLFRCVWGFKRTEKGSTWTDLTHCHMPIG